MSHPTSPAKEGTVPFPFRGDTHQTFYKLYGSLSSTSTEPNARPLVALHGGPGVTHDYLTPLGDINALSGRPVIIYDQIGNGKSTHLRDKPDDFWNIDLFICELENLLAQLGIAGDFDLLGHSWGGMLAAEFVIRRQPAGLNALILSNSLASSVTRNAEVQRLYKELAPEDAKVLLEGDASGNTGTPEYAKARQEFNKRFLCRLDPPPEPVIYSFVQSQVDPTVTTKMYVCPPFFISPVLTPFMHCRKQSDANTTWNIVSKLHTIRVPTLVLNGAHDFETDLVCAPFLEHIEGSRWVKFENSSHMMHWEEREKYMSVVDGFLDEHKDRKERE